MSEGSHSASGGTSVFTLLLVLFIGLKLAGFIQWSWFWVLSPFWIPLSIACLCGAIYLLMVIVERATKKTKPPQDAEH